MCSQRSMIFSSQRAPLMAGNTNMALSNSFLVVSDVDILI